MLENSTGLYAGVKGGKKFQWRPVRLIVARTLFSLVRPQIVNYSKTTRPASLSGRDMNLMNIFSGNIHAIEHELYSIFWGDPSYWSLIITIYR